MKRFFGMMPSSEIEISETYAGSNGYKYFIDAGPNGWTVRLPDQSSFFHDIKSTAENNRDEALSRLKEKFPNVTFTKNSESKEDKEICMKN